MDKKAAAAEWILSLVTPPDRAASMAGDLIEEGSARGGIWIWRNVWGVWWSHIWRDLRADPLRTVGLAFWGVLAYILAAGSLGILGILWRVDTHGPDGAVMISAPAPMAVALMLIFAYTAVPGVVGWAVACRSKGHELAAVLATVTLFAVLHVLSLYLSELQVRRMGQPFPGMDDAFAVLCARALFLTAGATLFRCRAHSRLRR